jgi:hypothetical protein
MVAINIGTVVHGMPAGFSMGVMSMSENEL